MQDAIEFVEADVTALQFADASFDLCVTYNGLHCLPDPHAALGELTRVLKPGWDAARDVMRYRSRSPQRCSDRNGASYGGVRKHTTRRRDRKVAEGIRPRCRDT